MIIFENAILIYKSYKPNILNKNQTNFSDVDGPNPAPFQPILFPQITWVPFTTPAPNQFPQTPEMSLQSGSIGFIPQMNHIGCDSRFTGSWAGQYVVFQVRQQEWTSPIKFYANFFDDRNIQIRVVRIIAFSIQGGIIAQTWSWAANFLMLPEVPASQIITFQATLDTSVTSTGVYYGIIDCSKPITRSPTSAPITTTVATPQIQLHASISPTL